MVRNRLFLYGTGLWLLFVVLAILNGIFRNSFITPKLGEHSGHIISSIIFICIIFLVTFIFLKKINLDYQRKDLIFLGGFWLILTILFEFGFGRYVANHSWDKLLADYNIFQGRLWSFVLLATFLAPLLTGSNKGKSSKE